MGRLAMSWFSPEISTTAVALTISETPPTIASMSTTNLLTDSVAKPDAETLRSRHVVLTGGTGLIGRALITRLLAEGARVQLITRRVRAAQDDPLLSQVGVIGGDPTQVGEWQDAIDEKDAVIHLAGQPVFGQRWNPAVKQAIRNSRVLSSARVSEAIQRARRAPSVLVSASAVGYYGPHGDEWLDETSPPGVDFLAQVCVDWEAAVSASRSASTRVAIVRVGIVLARNAGMLGTLSPIIRFVPAGASPVGNARSSWLPGVGGQWTPWIHLDDIVELFLLALRDPAAVGPINGVAPNPVTNAEFMRALARKLHRPFVPIGPPERLLRVVLGEVATLASMGQRVTPKRALELGYQFRFPRLQEALDDLFAVRGGK